MTDEPPAGERARRARPSRGIAPPCWARVEAHAEAGATGRPNRGRAWPRRWQRSPISSREPDTAAWSEVAAPPADHVGWSGNGSSAVARPTQAAAALAPAPPTQPAARAVPGPDAEEPGPNGAAVGAAGVASTTAADDGR